jgi:hypothetical protein
MKNKVNNIESFIPLTIKLLREAVTFNKESEYGTPIPDGTINRAISELDKFITRYTIYKVASIVFGIIIMIMAIVR